MVSQAGPREATGKDQRGVFLRTSVRRASSEGHPNFGLAVIGLVVVFVGLGTVFLWTSYRHPIVLVLAMLCIFIGLVLVAAGAGIRWFPMMGVEKWRTSQSENVGECSDAARFFRYMRSQGR